MTEATTTTNPLKTTTTKSDETILAEARKRIKGLQKRKGGKRLTKKGKLPKNNGLVYLGHIPHGFYEKEIKEFFTQFGEVGRVKVSRSPKTGKSKGYAFVEFVHDEVAQIVAETMNNYLMFERLIKAQYIPPEKVHPNMFPQRWITEDNYPTLNRRKKLKAKQERKSTPAKMLNHCKRIKIRMNQALKKLSDLGIVDYKPQIYDPEDLCRKLAEEAVRVLTAKHAAVKEDEEVTASIDSNGELNTEAPATNASDEPTTEVVGEQLSEQPVLGESVAVQAKPQTPSQKTPKSPKTSGQAAASPKVQTPIQKTPKGQKTSELDTASPKVQTPVQKTPKGQKTSEQVAASPKVQTPVQKTPKGQKASGPAFASPKPQTPSQKTPQTPQTETVTVRSAEASPEIANKNVEPSAVDAEIAEQSIQSEDVAKTPQPAAAKAQTPSASKTPVAATPKTPKTPAQPAAKVDNQDSSAASGKAPASTPKAPTPASQNAKAQQSMKTPKTPKTPAPVASQTPKTTPKVRLAELSPEPVKTAPAGPKTPQPVAAEVPSTSQTPSFTLKSPVTGGAPKWNVTPSADSKASNMTPKTETVAVQLTPQSPALALRKPTRKSVAKSAQKPTLQLTPKTPPLALTRPKRKASIKPEVKVDDEAEAVVPPKRTRKSTVKAVAELVAAEGAVASLTPTAGTPKRATRRSVAKPVVETIPEAAPCTSEAVEESLPVAATPKRTRRSSIVKSMDVDTPVKPAEEAAVAATPKRGRKSIARPVIESIAETAEETAPVVEAAVGGKRKSVAVKASSPEPAEEPTMPAKSPTIATSRPTRKAAIKASTSAASTPVKTPKAAASSSKKGKNV